MPPELIPFPPKAPVSREKLEALAQASREGRLLAFPTDTVYGIGTWALAPGAAERLYTAKGRDPRKALPVLIDSPKQARRWAVFPAAAEALARRFWPGALTLVLHPTPEGRALLSPGHAALALRVPDHDALRELLRLSGPWLSSSANRSGRPDPRDGAGAARELGDALDLVLDGGPCPGVPSTVIDATGERCRVLREGKWRAKDLGI